MPYNVVCAGEALIDLVSAEYATDLTEVRVFEPHVGGSPANLAHNLRMLGLDVGLVCAVGADAFGRRIVSSFRESGLPVELVTEVPGHRTTLVAVTKSKGSPDFEVYRGADCEGAYAPFEVALASGTEIFHTTAFALSRAPMRSHLQRVGAAFAKTGATLSIDANYAEKVWPDRARAQRVILDYLRRGALVKMSEVDYERLYEKPLTMNDAQAAAEPLLAAGARLVCFTFGGEGAVAVTPEACVRHAPPPIDIVDATGAGDSFWAGFLAAYLANKVPSDCLRIGAEVAAKKLRQQGPLRERVEWA